MVGGSRRLQRDNKSSAETWRMTRDLPGRQAEWGAVKRVKGSRVYEDLDDLNKSGS